MEAIRLESGMTFLVPHILTKFKILLDGQNHNLVINLASKGMAFFLTQVATEFPSLFAFELHMFMFQSSSLFSSEILMLFPQIRVEMTKQQFFF